MSPSNPKRKLCINLFAGPGAGKTTVAAELFVALKKRGIDCEIVSEFAKDAVLEGNPDVLKHQWFVLAHQAYRVHCAYKHMQVVIVDSPILLGPIYDRDSSRALYDLCIEHHKRYDNLNIVVQRELNNNYTMAGRVHSLTESISIDNRILDMLHDLDIPYIKYTTNNDVDAPDVKNFEGLLELVLEYIQWVDANDRKEPV